MSLPIGFVGMLWLFGLALTIAFVALRMARNGRAAHSVSEVLYDTEHPGQRR